MTAVNNCGSHLTIDILFALQYRKKQQSMTSFSSEFTVYQGGSITPIIYYWTEGSVEKKKTCKNFCITCLYNSMFYFSAVMM